MRAREISAAASRLRRDLGKSYARMAEEIGVSPRTFDDYRRGRRTPPLWRVRRIQAVLRTRQERELFPMRPALSYVGSGRTDSYLNNIVLSRNGGRIAATDLIGGIYSFFIRNDRVLKHREMHIDLSSSDVYLGKTDILLALTRYNDHDLRLWDVDMRKETARISGIGGASSLSPGGNYLACVSWENILCVHQVIPRSIPIRYDNLTVFKERARLDLKEMFESGSCGGLHFSDDETAICFSGPQEEVIVYPWASADGVRVLPGMKIDFGYRMKLSPDNSLLAMWTDRTSSYDPQEKCSVRIWDVESARLVRELPAASPATFINRNDSVCLVYYSGDGTIEIEDAFSGKGISSHLLPCLDRESPMQIDSIEISADGSLMAISGNIIDDEVGMGTREETDILVIALDWG